MDNGKGEWMSKADNGRKFRGQPRRIQASSVQRPFKKPRKTGAEQVLPVNATEDPKPKRSKPTARPRWVYEPAVSTASPYWDVLAVDAIRLARAGNETIIIIPHSPLCFQRRFPDHPSPPPQHLALLYKANYNN